MSKEKIHTMPVLDAFKDASECPFCKMYETLEGHMLEFVLGNSYMEEDIREETNRLGFCKTHFRKLYDQKNRLGLALILQTHMMKLQKDIDHLTKASLNSAKTGFFSKKSENNETDKFDAYKSKHEKDCYVCHRIDNTFDIYMDTFFYIWKSEPDFKDTVKASHGFCVEHFLQLYALSAKKLKDSELQSFSEILLPLQKENFARVLGDIDWFITKYDYRYRDEPWKNSQDAIQRAIKKVASIEVQ